MKKENRGLILVRGAGDLSTGTIHRLHRAGYPVAALETAHPSAIRRRVAFSEAVYQGRTEVEGVTAVLAKDLKDLSRILSEEQVPVLVDPEGNCIRELGPAVLVDAILAKKNLGTRIDMAPLTIGLGPGFEAGRDVDYVIETMRGHDLGRILSEGSALPDTGVPGIIGGYGKERVIHTPAAGVFRPVKDIGDEVTARDIIAVVNTGTEILKVRTEIGGILRGILPDGYPVHAGCKAADVDPRPGERKNCGTISDKARCIAGSVLELVCRHRAET